MAKFNLNLPKKLAFLVTQRARYKVAYGGRGSAKSWSFAQALIFLARSKKLRILCTREVQKSIKDSVYRLLLDQIEALGLGGEFEITRDEIRCRATGSMFLFSGLSDKTATSIKSFEGVDICWVEEAQTVSERSWSILIPTIRANGSEIWVSFNPDLETDPTYVRFVVNTIVGAIVVKVNWDDNPWFPAVLRVEKDNLFALDPDAAAHVWGGQCRRNSDAQILRGRYVVESFEPKAGLWDGPYHGIDFGFSQDPGTLNRVWIWEGDLYIEYEAFGLEVDTDDLPALWDTIPDAREYVARADCARPETISGVKRLGYKRVTACKKWTGCERDGIDHLRSYKRIVIHTRCPNAAMEARLWSWKKDRLTGDILNVTTGKFDNTWAAIRYALEPIILNGLQDKTPEEDEDEDEFNGQGGGGSSQNWMM